MHVMLSILDPCGSPLPDGGLAARAGAGDILQGALLKGPKGRVT